MPKRKTNEELQQENEHLRESVKKLEAEIVDLKAVIKGMLKQDSRNSHKPPSHDKKRYPTLKLADKDRENKTARTRARDTWI